MSSTQTKQKPAPPQAAVDRDPHWSTTRDKLRNRKRPIMTLTICDDQSAKQALASAEYVERRARANAEENPSDQEAQKVLKAAETALENARNKFQEAAIVLRFQAMRRPDFEALKKAHPATEEQAEDGMAFNPETLGPELIAAASMDGITEEEAAEYLTEWAEGEAAQLFDTAWQVQGETRADLGKG